MLLRNYSRSQQVRSGNESEITFYGSVKASCEGSLKVSGAGTIRFLFNEKMKAVIFDGHGNKSKWWKGRTFSFDKYVIAYFTLFIYMNRCLSIRALQVVLVIFLNLSNINLNISGGSPTAYLRPFQITIVEF